ncbi:MAG: CRISPR-associated protein Cas5 [Tepidisphaeraceae bacterium]|jgi:CRISPR-associated protein Cas5d
MISLEVAGPFAMFSRPDTGSTPISYPVPTYSAAKGMFEAVSRVPQVYVRPVKIEICKPIRYERFVTNYGGPLRKPAQCTKDNNYQLVATVLVDVQYRLYAELIVKRSTRGKARQGTRRRRGKDWAAMLKDRFEQRLADGQTFYTPCLGWKEFVPTYFGPLQSETRPDQSIDMVIPSLLHEMWEHKQPKPTFRQNVEIVKGVMWFDRRASVNAQ